MTNNNVNNIPVNTASNADVKSSLQSNALPLQNIKGTEGQVYYRAELNPIKHDQSKLTFANGKAITLEISPAQQTLLSRTKYVDVAISDKQIILKSPNQVISSQLLPESGLVNIVSQAIRQTEQNSIQANLIIAKVQNGVAQFEFNGTQFKLPISDQLLKQLSGQALNQATQAISGQTNVNSLQLKSLHLLVSPTQYGIQVQVVNQAKSTTQLPITHQVQINNKHLIVSGHSFSLPSVSLPKSPLPSSSTANLANHLSNPLLKGEYIGSIHTKQNTVMLRLEPNSTKADPVSGSNASSNPKIIEINLNQFKTTQAPKILDLFAQAMHLPLLKTVHIQDNKLSLSLAKQTINLPYNGENSTLKSAQLQAKTNTEVSHNSLALNQIKSPQLANITIKNNQVSLTLQNGDHLQFLLPQKQIAQGFLAQHNQSTNTDAQSLNAFLTQNKISISPEALQQINKQSAHSSFSASLNADSILTIQSIAKQSVKIENTPALKASLEQLITPQKNSGNTQPTDSPLKSAQHNGSNSTSGNTQNISRIETQYLSDKAAQYQPKLSEQSLLQQLNKLTELTGDIAHTTNNKQKINASNMVSTELLKQVKNQTPPNFAQALTQLINQIQNQENILDTLFENPSIMAEQLSPSAIKNLLSSLSPSQSTSLPSQRTSGLPASADAIQQLINSQINLPQSLANLNNNAGIVNQLLAAFQLLSKASHKSNSHVTSDKKTQTNKLTLSEAGTKTLKSLAQSIHHLQHNQKRTALSTLENKPQIYASVPFGHTSGQDSEIRQAEVKIELPEQDDQHTENPALSLWKFSLKFDLAEYGQMLTKAALVDNELRLNLYCDQQSTAEIATHKLNILRQNLSHSGIQLNQTDINAGTIPEHLWSENAIKGHYTK